MSCAGERVLITGGAGFIGSTLAQRLTEAKEVILFDNLTNDAFKQTNLRDQENVTFVEGDILDADAVRRAADGVDVIVHMAAIAGVSSVLKSPVRTMRVNLIGTANVVDAAAEQLPRLRRFIDFSTSEVFGKHAYKVEETHETSGGSVGEARWTYAVSKLAGEYYTHAYFDEMQLPAATVRPFNIYGPNQVGVGAIHNFMKRALTGEDLIIHGDGAQIRAWCYIDDIVSSLECILDNDASIGQSFNIGNVRSVCTTYDLALRINRICGEKSRLVHQELHYSDVEIRIPDITKAREVLDWEPRVDLDEGLERTRAWYEAQLALPA
jgi:nucleoside-diphosphate-sugar epimerase